MPFGGSQPQPPIFSGRGRWEQEDAEMMDSYEYEYNRAETALDRKFGNTKRRRQYLMDLENPDRRKRRGHQFQSDDEEKDDQGDGDLMETLARTRTAFIRDMKANEKNGEEEGGEVEEDVLARPRHKFSSEGRAQERRALGRYLGLEDGEELHVEDPDNKGEREINRRKIIREVAHTVHEGIETAGSSRRNREFRNISDSSHSSLTCDSLIGWELHESAKRKREAEKREERYLLEAERRQTPRKGPEVRDEEKDDIEGIDWDYMLESPESEPQLINEIKENFGQSEDTSCEENKKKVIREVEVISSESDFDCEQLNAFCSNPNFVIKRKDRLFALRRLHRKRTNRGLKDPVDGSEPNRDPGPVSWKTLRARISSTLLALSSISIRCSDGTVASKTIAELSRGRNDTNLLILIPEYSLRFNKYMNFSLHRCVEHLVEVSLQDEYDLRFGKYSTMRNLGKNSIDNERSIIQYYNSIKMEQVEEDCVRGLQGLHERLNLNYDHHNYNADIEEAIVKKIVQDDTSKTSSPPPDPDLYDVLQWDAKRVMRNARNHRRKKVKKPVWIKRPSPVSTTDIGGILFAGSKRERLKKQNRNSEILNMSEEHTFSDVSNGYKAYGLDCHYINETEKRRRNRIFFDNKQKLDNNPWLKRVLKNVPESQNSSTLSDDYEGRSTLPEFDLSASDEGERQVREMEERVWGKRMNEQGELQSKINSMIQNKIRRRRAAEEECQYDEIDNPDEAFNARMWRLQKTQLKTLLYYAYKQNEKVPSDLYDVTDILENKIPKLELQERPTNETRLLLYGDALSKDSCEDQEETERSWDKEDGGIFSPRQVMSPQPNPASPQPLDLREEKTNLTSAVGRGYPAATQATASDNGDEVMEIVSLPSTPEPKEPESESLPDGIHVKIGRGSYIALDGCKEGPFLNGQKGPLETDLMKEFRDSGTLGESFTTVEGPLYGSDGRTRSTIIRKYGKSRPKPRVISVSTNVTVTSIDDHNEKVEDETKRILRELETENDDENESETEQIGQNGQIVDGFDPMQQTDEGNARYEPAETRARLKDELQWNKRAYISFRYGRIEEALFILKRMRNDRFRIRPEVLETGALACTLSGWPRCGLRLLREMVVREFTGKAVVVEHVVKGLCEAGQGRECLEALWLRRRCVDGKLASSHLYEYIMKCFERNNQYGLCKKLFLQFKRDLHVRSLKFLFEAFINFDHIILLERMFVHWKLLWRSSVQGKPKHPLVETLLRLRENKTLSKFSETFKKTPEISKRTTGWPMHVERRVFRHIQNDVPDLQEVESMPGLQEDRNIPGLQLESNTTGKPQSPNFSGSKEMGIAEKDLVQFKLQNYRWAAETQQQNCTEAILHGPFKGLQTMNMFKEVQSIIKSLFLYDIDASGSTTGASTPSISMHMMFEMLDYFILASEQAPQAVVGLETSKLELGLNCLVRNIHSAEQKAAQNDDFDSALTLKMFRNRLVPLILKLNSQSSGGYNLEVGNE